MLGSDGLRDYYGSGLRRRSLLTAALLPCRALLSQGLPGPDLRPPDPFRSPGTPPPGAVSIGATDAFGAALPRPEAARDMASRALSGIQTLSDTVQKNQSMIN
jgi:hypothetical protein